MFSFFKRKPKEVPVEKPSLVGTTWYVEGINNDEPILEIDKVEDGYVTAHFIDEANLGKTHYQAIEQFMNCFSKY